MIALLMALAAAQVGPFPTPNADAPIPELEKRPPAPSAEPRAAPVSDQDGYAQCAALVRSDAERALIVANEWLVRGGGIFARQCAGLAYVELGRWDAAASAFAQAAEQAETTVDPRRADFWVQAGNSWLAAGDALQARRAFDSALATALLAPQLRGEVHLDRARAGVALDDLAGARVDLDKGLELVPQDPFGWYLSSALALKEKDLARAQDDIAEAVRLAPDDANLLVHAGNVAGISGEVEAARGLYARAIRLAPGTDAAKAAQAALAANR